MKEIAIQKSILEFLEWQKDIYFFRSGSGSFKTDQGRYFKTGRRGCPDITIGIRSLAVFLEVKSDKGKLSPDQKKAQQQIERSGCVYEVVRSVDDVEKLLNIIRKL